MENQKLYEMTLNQMKPIQLRQLGTAGHVACALESIDGNIYTGICIDMPCSIGLCAEQSAIAEMLKNGKTQITKLIAVYEDGSILPPCGRCRVHLCNKSGFLSKFFPHAEGVENLLVN
ncbi:cytidine deaminase family protein [Tetragenococcus halophilus]|uniref:cytidine deaminase family protein n=1 Tax=Tetragenococcus halophilus TaxID=51669 RepID=UPI001E489799|nr:cytidine deaminase [Tetragenococcus halophilus]